MNAMCNLRSQVFSSLAAAAVPTSLDGNAVLVHVAWARRRVEAGDCLRFKTTMLTCNDMAMPSAGMKFSARLCVEEDAISATSGERADRARRLLE